MNESSTNRSFDAAMRLFQTRQRLEGGGVGQHEGDCAPLGRIGGLALSAGFGLHRSGLGGEHGAAVGLLHSLSLHFGNVEVSAILGDVAPRSRRLGDHTRLRKSWESGMVESRAGGSHGLAHQLSEFGGDADGQRVGVAGVGHGAFRREATELAGLGVAGLDGDLAEVSGGGAVASGDAVNVNLATSHGDHAGGDLCGGESGVHGLLRTGPIPAMSNPKSVTSDMSSPFGKRIMNGPIPYQITEAGRALLADRKEGV